MKNLIVFFILSFQFFFSQEKSKTVFDVARSVSLQEIKILMKQDPNIINSTNENGFSPLILACYRGNIEVAKFLIENVKDLNYKSKEGTALAGLAIRYNKDLVNLLLQHKANPNIADSSGTTPLFWAVKTGNKELVEILIKNGADTTLKDNMGFTPFEYALKANKQDIINLLKN